MRERLLVCRCLGDGSPSAKAIQGWRKRLPRHVIGSIGCPYQISSKTRTKA